MRMFAGPLKEGGGWSLDLSQAEQGCHENFVE